MPIAPLDPLITFEEVENTPKLFGKSKNVGLLFRALNGLKAFPENSAKVVATRCLYAPHKNPNEQSREWGDYRFERLRRGEASATEREARFFHDAFAHVFSEDWANRVSLKELITNPLGQLIARLQAIAPMKNSDPIQLAFMLEAMSAPDAPQLDLVPDSTRWGTQGDASAPTLLDDIPTLHAGTYFSLSGLRSATDLHPLVLELADEPLVIDGGEVRAQRMTRVVQLEGRLEIQSDTGGAIEVSPVPGRFHYLCLLSESEWPPLPQYLSTGELQELLNGCLERAMSDEKLQASITSYRVEQ